MENISYETKIDMIKSQLKRFEIFQDHHRLFVRLPCMIDENDLSAQKADVLFHTLNEGTVIECDIEQTNGEALLALLTELNTLHRRAYDV